MVATNREVNLKEVLRYELSTDWMALAPPDGNLRKTAKSQL